MRYTQTITQTNEDYEPTYLFSLEVHDHEVKEVTDWIGENIWRPVFTSYEQGWLKVHFAESADAVHFKLRYADERL